MLTLGVGAPEKIIRTVAVYLALAVLLRLAGKRDLAQLDSFDLVVMLLLSNVVQNAVIGPDNSLAGGLLGALVLVVFNSVMVRVSLASDPLHRLLEGTPTLLAEHGVWNPRALWREGLRRADVDAALRRQNANDVTETERVSLEPGGAVVATLLTGAQAATREDVQRLEAKLDALLARDRGHGTGTGPAASISAAGHRATHGQEAPCRGTRAASSGCAARASTTCATSTSTCPATRSSWSPGSPGPASRRWPSAPCTPRRSCGTSSRWRRTPAGCCTRSAPPPWRRSPACRRRSRCGSRGACRRPGRRWAR